MKQGALYPRYLRPRIAEALADSPVVLILGPRQCGKTTLARLVGDEKGFAYFTFDDDVQRAAAQADPVGYVADLPQRAVLDEMQRVPELFISLMSWFVYILRCRDGSLYTGYTNDIDSRVAAHNAGKGAKYTASRLPVQLVFAESTDSKSAAMRRELQIKRWTKAKKEALIQQDNSRLKHYSRCRSIHGRPE